MKLLRLDLPAFGPFTDVSLDLSAGNHGLHMVYGPNEAGKTSALRAMRSLFFGIDHKTSESFLHRDSSKLRLGAKLGHSDGSVLEFVRLKKTKHSLREQDGTTPLDSALWDRFLGGVDQNSFSQRFGIDHEELVRGGCEVLEGGGDLGEMLLSAGSGIAGLQGIQQALKSEAEALFLPRGRNQRIPTYIDQVNKAQDLIKTLQVTTEQWSQHDQALRAAEERKARLDTQKAAKQRELNRLRRFQSAQQLLGQRRALVEQCARLQQVVLLPADFTERRRAAEDRLASSGEEAARSREHLKRLRARHDEEPVDEPLLDAHKEVEHLRERRGEYRKAQADRPNLVAYRQANEHDARDVLESLGRPRDLKEAEALHLRADEPPQIHRLAREADALVSQRKALRKTLARHREEAARLDRELAEAPAPPDLDPLLGVLKSATRQYDIEPRRDAARDQLATLEANVEAARRRLPGWTGSAEALAALVVPMPETIARGESQYKDAEDALRHARSEERRALDDIAELEARLAAEASRRDLPTEDDLRRCRLRRDDGWRLVRRAWLDGEDDPVAVAKFLAALPPGRTLADGYEEQVARGDEIADRLRREANEIAQRGERLNALDGHRARLARAAQARADAQGALDGLSAEWGAMLAGLGVGPLEPSELRAWLGHREKLLDLVAQANAQRVQAERLAGQVDDLRAGLSSVLATTGERPAADDEPLTAMVDRAQEVADRRKALALRRKELAGALEKSSTERDRARDELAAVEERHDAWLREWSKWMGRIGLGPEDTAEQAVVFLENIQKLDEYLKAAHGFERRIQTIDRDADQFVRAVDELAARLAPDLAGFTPDATVDALAERLRVARERHQTRVELNTQIRNEEERLATRLQAIDEARRMLEALRREARRETIAQLPDAEERSAERSRAEESLRLCERQLLGHSAGATVEAFVAEAESLDFDGLDLNIEAIESEVAKLQGELDTLNQTIGAERTHLDAMDGGSKAAEANDQVGHALARLQADVPRYVALRLAAHLLQQGIERHREQNQAPVLERASELFARLTLGSFARLAIEETDKGKSVLVGVRPDGSTTLRVEAMSDGSCDQLYLSLKIASLEIWLRAHEPIPLIVDDILLRFDNPRSVAALQVLAELSDLTQVIFFTHHAHLIDLARENLSDAVLFTHELASSPLIVADSAP